MVSYMCDKIVFVSCPAFSWAYSGRQENDTRNNYEDSHHSQERLEIFEPHVDKW